MIYSCGRITQYGIIRILPFGGEVQLVDINGDLLKRIMDKGEQAGGPVSICIAPAVKKSKNDQWIINSQQLYYENKNYKMSIASYLVDK